MARVTVRPSVAHPHQSVLLAFPILEPRKEETRPASASGLDGMGCKPAGGWAREGRVWMENW